MWEFWVDRGGTFTDIIASNPEGRQLTKKLLSTHPDYDDAAAQGIREFLAIPSGEQIPAHTIKRIRMGTTVTVNALLEGKGSPTLLLTTAGFADVPMIRYQSRTALFDPSLKKQRLLNSSTMEVGERVDAEGKVIQALDLEGTKAQLLKYYERGLRSCAICLLHSVKNPHHENLLFALAKEIGFTKIYLSHLLNPVHRFLPRLETTLLEAYLDPILESYKSNFFRNLNAKGSVAVEFMQSHGGLCTGEVFRARNSLLSGPAGGVRGAIQVGQSLKSEKIVAFDMGGTSTDVYHYNGILSTSNDHEIAGVNVQVPMLDIHTVAAGGGSRLKYLQGRLEVGPESVGATPGPACYGRGGNLAVTDANLILGRLVPEAFLRPLVPTAIQDCVLRKLKMALPKSQRLCLGKILWKI